uniref:Transposase n=1 Tax=Globodera rostochiensis TaxID=31243 RepID=A0A914HNG9_GLORO
MPPPPTNFGQNVHHQIDRQNTQIGQIEPNSTDQNLPLTESDHSDNAKNGEEISSNEKKKFDQRKAELNCVGIKNSHQNEINEIVAKELGLCFKTIYAWKRKLGQTTPNHKYSHNEQKELMKRYYEIKDKNPKISDQNIAKMLKINVCTLIRWKKQFKRQQMHPNSVDGHSVQENAAANVQNSEQTHLSRPNLASPHLSAAWKGGHNERLVAMNHKLVPTPRGVKLRAGVCNVGDGDDLISGPGVGEHQTIEGVDSDVIPVDCDVIPVDSDVIPT